MRMTNCSAARKLVLSVVGVSLLLLAAGCGSRGTVSGKVLYKGKPLPGGNVIFYHQKGSSFSAIEEDGSYRIDKLPVGPVKISVTGPSGAAPSAVPKDAPAEKIKSVAPPPNTEEEGPQAMMKGMMGPQSSQGKKPTVIIPPKYGNPEQSGLTYTVGSGSQTHDIKLE